MNLCNMAKTVWFSTRRGCSPIIYERSVPSLPTPSPFIYRLKKVQTNLLLSLSLRLLHGSPNNKSLETIRNGVKTTVQWEENWNKCVLPVVTRLPASRSSFTYLAIILGYFGVLALAWVWGAGASAGHTRVGDQLQTMLQT